MMFSKAMIEKVLSNIIDVHLGEDKKEFSLNIAGKVLKVTIEKEREIDDETSTR